MKNVKDLGPKEVVHCSTEEEAETIVQLMRDNGGFWLRTYWDTFNENTCYHPYNDEYSIINFYEEGGYTIHPAADFIYKENKKEMINQLTIEIPYGHEIDQENSDLAKGVVKFKPKNKLPTKWEEVGRISGCYISHSSSIMDVVELRSINNHRNVWPTEELAKASLALCQLVRLKDIYNEGWQPDWSDGTRKYTISYFSEGIGKDSYLYKQHILSFKDEKTRDLFLTTFKDLIEEAKPLL